MALPINPSTAQIALAVRELERRVARKGTVSLTPNGTATIINDPRVFDGDDILLSPKSASALMMGGWVSTVSAGRFVITHAASSATDRTFVWCAV